MKKINLEKNWLLIVGVIVFSLRYIIPVRIEALYDIFHVNVAKAVKGCAMTMSGYTMTGCGFARFLNISLLVLFIALLGYYIYWNYDDLKLLVNKFLNKLKK